MPSPGVLTDTVALVATIDPQTVVNSEVFTDVIDTSLWHTLKATLALGNMANETIDFRCCTCDSDGGNPATLKAATQLAASASANDNKQVIINVRSAELTATNKRYVKFGVVTGNSTGGPVSVLVDGAGARYKPASGNDLSSVAQIVA